MTKITIERSLIEQAIEALPDVLGTSHFSLRMKLRAAQVESARRMEMMDIEAAGYSDRRRGLPDTRAEPAERRQGPRRLADETT